MFKNIILVSLIANLTFCQDASSLKDSIFKYKHKNPSLALDYAIEYNDLGFNRKQNSELQQVYGAMGEILNDLGFHVAAINYLQQSIKIYDALPKNEKKFPELNQPPGVLLNIGNVYFNSGQYDKADEIFKQTIKLYETLPDVDEKFFGINTAMSNRALIKQNMGDFLGAKEIYNDVYNRRKEYGKVVDIIYSMNSLLTVFLLNNEISKADDLLVSAKNLYEKELLSGNNNPILKRNMGYSYFSYGAIMQYKKQFEKAIFYLNESKNYLKGFQTDISAAGSRLAECYLGLNKFEEAENIAIKNLQVKNLNENEKKFNYKVLEKIYKITGVNSKLLDIKDSLIQMSSGLSSLKISKALDNFDTEVKLSNSAKLLNETKIKNNTYLYISLICFVLLLSLIFGLRINNNLQKEVAHRLETEKKLMANELDQKNRELVSKSNFILQRNEYLKKIQAKFDSELSRNDEIKTLKLNLNSIINSEKSYKDFDKMFVNVYPDFYKKLNQVATLSITDLRLASLIKMNHTNSEIALISGLSTRTIESQRYRLSKKLKLEKNQSLNSYLLSI